jgi:retron-type reverse transcriptase
MPRRHDRLFEQIASFAALHRAARRALRGKRRKPGPAAFFANLEPELLRLELELGEGSWRPGRYTTVQIRDPKRRMVSIAPFRDRVVHHALCAVVEPIFERGFIFDSFANRVGKGTHRAIARYEKFRNRSSHVLRCDLYRYFPSIDHEILKLDLRRRVACARTLELLDRIIDGSNPQEPVHVVYPGDDLFSSLARRKGLPIGNLTSQFFGNVYLDGLDHYVREVLRPRGYLRFVDDFALFCDDSSELAEFRERISLYLGRRRLALHPRKTYLQACREPAEFLGFVLHPSGRRLPEQNVRRFRNRLRGLRDRWRVGRVSVAEVAARIGSWVAHAEHADTWRLRCAIFSGGWYDPALGPGRPPRRVLRGGSWNNNAQNLRSANRNQNGTANRNDNDGFRVASTLSARAAESTDSAGVQSCVQGRP